MNEELQPLTDKLDSLLNHFGLNEPEIEAEPDDEPEDDAELGALVDKILNYRRPPEFKGDFPDTLEERIQQAGRRCDWKIERVEGRATETLDLMKRKDQRWAILLSSLLAAAISVAATIGVM